MPGMPENAPFFSTQWEPTGRRTHVCRRIRSGCWFRRVERDLIVLQVEESRHVQHPPTFREAVDLNEKPTEIEKRWRDATPEDLFPAV